MMIGENPNTFLAFPRTFESRIKIKGEKRWKNEKMVIQPCGNHEVWFNK